MACNKSFSGGKCRPAKVTTVTQTKPPPPNPVRPAPPPKPDPFKAAVLATLGPAPAGTRRVYLGGGL